MQVWKVPLRIAVTPFGTTIDVNAAASLNVPYILSKPEGRVADNKEVH